MFSTVAFEISVSADVNFPTPYPLWLIVIGRALAHLSLMGWLKRVYVQKNKEINKRKYCLNKLYGRVGRCKDNNFNSDDLIIQVNFKFKDKKGFG